VVTCWGQTPGSDHGLTFIEGVKHETRVDSGLAVTKTFVKDNCSPR